MLDQRVTGLHVGVGVGRARGQEAMGDFEALDLGMKAHLALALVLTAVLRAVVGGQHQPFHGHAVVLEMGQDALGGHGGVGGGQLVGIVDEQGAAFHVAQRVLVARQAVGHHLGPVGGDVVERFGVGLEALEGLVGGLDGAQVVFLLALVFAPASHAGLAQDASDGPLRGAQAEQILEPPWPGAGQLLARGQHPALLGEGGLVGAGAGRARELAQAGAAFALEALQPFAHRIARTAEQTGGGLDAMGARMDHHAQAPIKEVVFGSGHVAV